MSNQVQPIYILPEGTQRTQGKSAHKNNILAAKLVGETVRTTLGPKGMDKMLVDSMGDIIVTNDGVTILEEMQIEHPAAKMIVEIAKTQENEVGDGTTTAVVLAGELLKNAELLLEIDIHPTIIAIGYRISEKKSMEILNKICSVITILDTDILEKIAQTAMTGKGAENSKENLANLTVETVKSIAEGSSIDKNNIKIEKKVGGSVEDTELVKGIILDKERVNSSMPKKVDNPKIVLIDSALEIKTTEIDAKIQITDPNQIQAFMDQEENMLKKMVDKIEKSGANVVFCQKGIDDLVQHFLAKKGIYAVRRVKRSDMTKLSKATGAKIATNLDELSSEDLGAAQCVEEKKVGEEEMTFVSGCKNPKSVTLLIRGGTEHVVDEIKRAIEDAIGDVIASIKVGKVVAGAGAVEIELANQLRSYANSLSGREQLAVLSYADSMEIIPITLAENSGLDPIDVVTEMKSSHDNNLIHSGINVFSGKVMDSWKEGIIEPLKIKTQAISSSTEVAIMILRIDDVIAGSGTGEGQPTPDGQNLQM